MNEIDKGVPDVDVEALMEISGLDSISALGLSSIQTDQGFCNKLYLHASNGVKGLLSVGNSAHSHKSKILMGAAVPTLISESIFTLVGTVDKMIQPYEVFEDLKAQEEDPHKHENKDIHLKPLTENN